MSIVALEMNRPCTIYHMEDTGTPDDYGDQVLEADDGTAAVCELQRPGGSGLRSGGEPEGGALDVSLWAAFFPAGTVLSGRDYFVVDGQQYDLVGDPAPVRDPWTRQIDHVEALARRRV